MFPTTAHQTGNRLRQSTFSNCLPFRSCALCASQHKQCVAATRPNQHYAKRIFVGVFYVEFSILGMRTGPAIRAVIS